jgi:hypothetical protein
MEAAMTYARAVRAHHPASGFTGTSPAGTVTGSGFTGTLADVHAITSGTFPEGTLTGSGITPTEISSYDLIRRTLREGMSTRSGFTGTMTLERYLFEATERDPQRKYWASPNIIAEFADSQQIFDTIQPLYLSSNTSRDRQIADRITALHRDALADDEHILPASLHQFTDFFLTHTELGIPKITLTPDGTLRARWIHGPKHFVAIEFTGEPRAKLVAEIPRDDGLTASYFAAEPISDIVSAIRALGASFA